MPHKSFKNFRLASSTATTYTPVSEFVIRLVAGSSNNRVDVYDGTGTATATRILAVASLANSSEEQVNAIRVGSLPQKITVKLTTTAGGGEAYVGVA